MLAAAVDGGRPVAAGDLVNGTLSPCDGVVAVLGRQKWVLGHHLQM